MSTQTNAKKLKKKWSSKTIRNKISKAMMREILTHNILPHDEATYDRSIYSKWLDRIEEGAKQEVARGLQCSTPEELENGDLPDELFSSEELSWYMYAALVVALWSRVEDMIHGCRNACSLPDKYISYHPKFPQYLKFFKTLPKGEKFDLKNLPHFQMINAVRILNNSFKHSNGTYHESPPDKPDKEVDILKKGLFKQLGIEKRPRINYKHYPGKCKEEADRLHKTFRIDYASLNHKELIFACGAFCNELLGKINKHRPPRSRMISGEPNEMRRKSNLS